MGTENEDDAAAALRLTVRNGGASSRLANAGDGICRFIPLSPCLRSSLASRLRMMGYGYHGLLQLLQSTCTYSDEMILIL